MLTIFITILFLQLTAVTQADLGTEPKSLHDIFQIIEKETGYKFLYRDALIAGKEAEFTQSDDWRELLKNLLEKTGLDASVDNERMRVVIFQRNETALPIRNIQGYVIDNESGERLPLATVSWQTNGDEIKSTQSDIRGQFRFPYESASGNIAIHVSYVGYAASDLEFSQETLPADGIINIRLAPSRVEISEIMVTGTSSKTPADSVYRGMLDVGTFSPFGESNSVRMLQTLPSVSNGASLSEGAYIRGSNSDALRVTLDGAVIYNHSHLFGLIDSFNPDVIRTGSFYYDVAPARYHAPPGGVLNLVTLSGSLYEFGGNVGFSNSVVKTSIDGPISEGRSSFLIAGRHSILNSINLFDTSDMVSWGLDINRENSLADDDNELNDRIITHGDYSVDFYDLHTKLFFERNTGSSWSVSGYLGGDNTSQISDRITRLSPNTTGGFSRSDFETQNQWGNRSANVFYFQSLGSDRMLHIQGGFSYLYTSYLKEDFIYRRPGRDADRPLIFFSDFENESELNHGYLNAELESDQFTLGGVLNIYDAAYREESLNRAEFFQRSQPVMPELYAEYRLGDANTKHSFNAGARLQLYSDGNYTHLSPRIKTALFQNSSVTVGVSAGRNYQYLYRLSINNQTTSDIWIMALEGQSPARSDQLSASLSFKPWRDSYFQVEGYFKQQQNLRFHEITFQNLESTFGGSPLFNNNDGMSRGVEFMIRQAFDKGDIVQTYTYSVAELKNDRFRNGEWFYADWDRRHSFNTVATYSPLPRLDLSLNWVYSTGRPDKVRLSMESQDRIGGYNRIDLSAGYSAAIGSSNIKLQAGVYNLTNRNNPWYRNWVQQIDRSGIRPRLSSSLVDVYDLGRQISLSVGVYF